MTRNNGTQTVLITGANRGIGLELARSYQEAGHRIIAWCRESNADLDAISSQVQEGVDIRESNSIQNAAAACDTAIDILINNAGILSQEALGELDENAFERISTQFNINSMGPLRVTEALLGQLKPGSKIALITSRMGSIADNSSGTRYGYRMSKAALNAAGKSLAIDLKEQSIAVGILHPGYVQTGMTGHTGHLSAAESAALLVARINELNMENSGQFWHANGELLPW